MTDYKKLDKGLERVFYEYIRLRDSNNGVFKCCSCRGIFRAENGKMHAGHYIPAGRSLATKYDERNVHGQCDRCNIHLHSNAVDYAVFMYEKYGQQVVDELHWKSHQPVKWTRDDFIQLRKKYRSKINELKRKKDSVTPH